MGLSALVNCELVVVWSGGVLGALRILICFACLLVTSGSRGLGHNILSALPSGIGRLRNLTSLYGNGGNSAVCTVVFWG